jgi:bifunctional DNase/RNase
MRAVDLVGITIEANTGAPLVVLREQEAPFRLLPIFVGETEAASIAIALSGAQSPRPLTHDLMATLMETLHSRLDSVSVTELRDGSYFAELVISGPEGDRCFDSRPSDGIALAVRLGAPVFVSEAILDEAGTAVNEVRAEAIDDEVREFRDELDAIDPSTLNDL